MPNSLVPASSRNSTVRYNEGLIQRIVLKNKKMKLEYETKRSREEDEKQYCTFSPNIRSRISTTPPPCNDDSFYLKNLEWQERRNKDIKRQQCERN